MDQAVIRALAKWPAVPAVYGWLALDERGNWLLRNAASRDFGRIGNAALREFIGRNYAPDAHGCWFFQNGPQRVYVRLACAPLVFRLDGERLVDHCGRPSGALTGAWRDERGGLILATASGPGNLDDRDLLAASDLIDESGADAWFCRGAGRVPLGSILRAELPARFGFVPDPRPEGEGAADST
ncbi:MAG TPA: DUF2946 family protein [Burkholderiales bacterium]|nr:DUF2946 family protein [Burkholderiales bacterium]